MLRWFPRFQVATTCFLCSPPDLNLVVTNFMFCIHVKQPLPPGYNPISVNKCYYYNYKIFGTTCCLHLHCRSQCSRTREAGQEWVYERANGGHLPDRSIGSLFLFLSEIFYKCTSFWCRIHLWFRYVGGFVRKVDYVTAYLAAQPSRLRAHHRNITTTRWRLCVTMETLWQQQYGSS